MKSTLSTAIVVLGSCALMAQSGVVLVSASHLAGQGRGAAPQPAIPTPNAARDFISKAKNQHWKIRFITWHILFLF